MKKVAFVTLGLLASWTAAGCSSEETPAPAVETVTDATPTQLEAFKVLEATTKKSWKWVSHPELKTPMHLSAPRKGDAVLHKGMNAAKATLDVLEQNKALFRMHDPARELSAIHEEVDDLGMTHARFQQMVHGVPVTGAELMAHYDKVGHLASIDANYVADLDGIDVNPAFEISAALSTVKADIISRSAVNESSLVVRDQRLVVYAANLASAKLAYEYKIDALGAHDPAIWVVTIDAKSGDILHRYNNLQTVQGRGAGVLGDQKQFEVAASGGGFVMTANPGVQIRTLTAEQQQVSVGIDVVSTNASSWDTGVDGQGAAVDAHFNAGAVFSYYKNVHGRNAINGTGGALISTVHFGDGYDNAAWTGTGMIYGDGRQVFRALSVSLDVVGHEFTHGVTERTSKLAYENQSGALNEAVSDIFGAFIEHSVKPDATKNWQIGEVVTLSGGALRDMMNPGSPLLQPQPANMSKFVNTQTDNGGVHINSGIINNAAFLMTMGGTNPVSKVEVKYGIGWEKSEKLWYRANTKYFMSTTNFGQAAQALLQAAKDIGLTENETNIVDCAFKATGIAQGSCATLVNPQSTTPGTETGDDSTTDESADGSGDSSEEETAPTPKRRRRVITESNSSGCNATGGNVDLGAAFGVAVAIAGLAAKRRKRS